MAADPTPLDLRRWLAAGASALATAATTGGVAVWLAPVCLVPLWLALRGMRAARAACLAAAHSVVTATLVFHWVFQAPGFGALEAVPFALLFAGYGALLGAAWGALERLGVGPLGGATAAALYCGCEWLRAHLGALALPWASLAHAVVEVPALLQWAAVAGESGLVFGVALANGAIAALVWQRPRGESLRAPLGALAGLGTVVAIGALRLAMSTPGPVVEVVALRTDFEPAPRLTPAVLQARFDALAAASRRAIGQPGGVDWVVWPESVLAQVGQAPALAVQLEALAAELDTSIVFGASESRHVLAEGRRVRRNLAWHVDPTRGLAEPYAKVRLLPFAEYLPLADALPWPRALREASFDLTPGTVARVFHAGAVGAAPIVCWESVLSDRVARSVRGGADLLLHLSNEAWFRSRLQARQHLATARLRAVELGRPVVSATNAGPARVVDGLGRLVAQSDAPGGFVRARVGVGGGSTPFLRFGDAWTALVAAFLIGVALRARATTSVRAAPWAPAMARVQIG